MATCGRYWARSWLTSVGHVVRVLNPHPGKALLMTTDTSPVACSAATMPGELSTITLSPKIQARRGRPEAGCGRSGRTGGPVEAVGTAVRPTAAVVASGGPTVPTSTTAAVATIPTAAKPTTGTWRRRCHAAQSARRSGRSTREERAHDSATIEP